MLKKKGGAGGDEKDKDDPSRRTKEEVVGIDKDGRVKSPEAKAGSPGKTVGLKDVMEEEKKPTPTMVEKTTAGIRGATTKVPTHVGSAVGKKSQNARTGKKSGIAATL